MRLLFTAVLGLALPAHAQLPPAASPQAPYKTDAERATPATGTTPLRVRLTDDLIRQAVHETLAEGPRAGRGTPSAQVLSVDRYQTFSREFSEAQKPSCLGPNALKFQQPGLSTKNWNVGIGGLFAIPFWAAAIARGKCQ